MAMKHKEGSLVQFSKILGKGLDAVEYFAKVSDYGRANGCILLESADVVAKYGEQSIGSAEPCLRLSGKGDDFSINALNPLGERFLEALQGELDFCDSVEYGKRIIKGALRSRAVGASVSEQERLKLRTHADIMRAVVFRFRPVEKTLLPSAGLFGAISYDFIDQFEKLPQNKKDILHEPDYEMYYLDNLFIANHREHTVGFFASALLGHGAELAAERERCAALIERYKKALNAKVPKARAFKRSSIRTATDTPKREFVSIVKNMKRHILAGDVFQVVPSRTVISDYCSEPFDIYKALRSINPSPYMFYFNLQHGALLGASPEMCIRVRGIGEKKVEIRPIAGTKPRGIVRGRVDRDLDSRYEIELRNDEKELAEHVMLVDLARNDVARVSKPGTRNVEVPFAVEKYSHVQHLVSSVSGTLKPGLDALHAYTASMNMGTLTGAPKVEAMRIVRKAEKTRRGFYGGAVGYITPSGDFDSAITIRSMRLIGGKAYIRAGAGIVYDSVPEKEFEETGSKARACLKAIEIAAAKR